MFCQTTRTRGFTLVELVVFMVVASVVIGGILYPFVTGVQEFDKPDETLVALNLAQSVMEQYFHTPFSELPITSAPINEIEFPQGYAGTKVIQRVDENLQATGTETPYKKIEVVITTPSSRTVSLHGVVTDWP